MPAGWWVRVQEEIRESEYAITWQERTRLRNLPAAWHAPNRAHGFRTYFAERGIRLIPRTEKEPSWEWGLALIGYGRAGDLRHVDSASLTASVNRMEYERGSVVEWYLNDPRGLEQGFTLSHPPEGGDAVTSDVAREPGARDAPVAPLPGARREPASADAEPLHLLLSLTGNLSPYLAADRRSIVFMTPAGVRVLRYAELIVRDAEGRDLPSHMDLFNEAGIRGIRLVIDDHGAAYPLQIDPLATSPAWSAESNQGQAIFGTSVGTAGDVNGDGFDDVIVGAPAYDNGQSNEGRAFVYHGSPSGPAASADWTAESDQAGAALGTSVATAGDVNGDGFSDVIIGAPAYANGDTDEGAAFVYHGSASGLDLGGARPEGSPANADWSAEGDQAGAEFGSSVAPAADVNGDGFGDVLVGAPSFDGGQTDEGGAFLYLGSASGPSATADWTAESDQAGAAFGTAVATAGDVTADGYGDIIVGAPLFDNVESDEGRAFLFLGAAPGPSPSADWTAESDQAGAEFGATVATAGDVNGDGFVDVIIGAPLFDNGETDEGGAFVYHGCPTGLDDDGARPEGSPSNADWSAESDQSGAELAASAATAGDVNGDGFADVIVGVPLYESTQPGEGAGFAFHGSPTGLDLGGSRSRGDPSNADWAAVGGQRNGHFASAVATAGDTDGDGFFDVIVGAPDSKNGHQKEGLAYLFHGSPTLPPSSPTWAYSPLQSDAEFGSSVSTAGDVNGDGFADIIVGAPEYDGGHSGEGRAFVFYGTSSGPGLTPDWVATSDQSSALMGRSAGTAGDVNGDGYDDVIIGAYLYDSPEGGEGAAFVFHGSPTGLDTGSRPIGRPSNADWRAESDQQGASLGISVATAGDVNGDGYADVIAGAWGYGNPQNREGGAFVFHGSPNGLDAGGARPVGRPGNADWTVESDQADAELGHFVSTAGDVNGDGYSDVIVGAEGYDNGQSDEGAAFVYHGSPSGLDQLRTRPVGTPANADWIGEADQADAGFGSSVASAGDVNGDGFDDLLVGARWYDHAQTDEGRACLYIGSASGLSPAPDWTVEGNQDDAMLGAVASAGDVNGDGFDDVLVGAGKYDNGETDEGRAWLYFGSAAGLSSGPAWTAEGDQEGAFFGTNLATAGDVNADGFADIIVGSWLFDVQLGHDHGQAFVYMGNGGHGVPVLRQQHRADGSAPIARLGTSDDETGFRLHVLGRTPFGSGRMKLQWEVEPFGTPFDGAGIGSGSWALGDEAGAFLNEPAGGLAPATLHHWRIRVLYSPATFPFQGRSRWLTSPWNAGMAADLRTGGCIDGDGDGFGVPASIDCPGSLLPDCDDTEPAVFPGAPEICVDGLNNDCDHPEWPSLDLEIDDDGDGQPECAGDCDDADPDRLAGVPELCDGIDNDCDEVVPPGENDTDGDGYRGCEGDCNNANPDQFPGNPEFCDGRDNDCDSVLPPDEADDDGDWFMICEGDCDDSNSSVHPWAPEICDGVNNDCNHPDWPSIAIETDDDGDGQAECAGDCDDANPNRRTGIGEACDGIDNDCDEIVPSSEVDADGDGVMICAADCDDDDPDRFPGNPEICDGLDNDCAGGLPADEADDDGDSSMICEGDCDDDDPNRFPGNPEICDGIDNDCAGGLPADEADDDTDGVLICQGDCDDLDDAIFPAAPEVCDGRNNDCDHPDWPLLTVESDDDTDGFAECAGDCDDSDPLVGPGFTELCDELDNDCDGYVDPGMPVVLETSLLDSAADPNAAPSDRGGSAILPLADLTGDGTPDFAVGAPGWPSGADRGAVLLFSGADRSLVRRMLDPLGSSPAELGSALASPGDLNGDGLDEIAAGAPKQSFGVGSQQGRVVLFSGATGGDLWTYQDALLPDNGGLGTSLASIQDLNADGIREIVAGAVLDCAGGLDCAGSASILDGSTGLRLHRLTDPAGEFGEQLGAAVASLGDLDGDGFDEIAVGAPGKSVSGQTGAGSVLIFSSGTTALLATFTDPAPAAGDSLGAVLAPMPDLDGDGKTDLLAGAPGRDTAAGADAGEVLLFSGGDGTLLRRIKDPMGDFGDRLPGFLSPIGDLNEDQFAEILAGSPLDDTGAGADAGSVLLFSGGTGEYLGRFGHPVGAAGDQFGAAVVALPSLDGDGVPEVASGAPGDDGTAGAASGTVQIQTPRIDGDCDGDGIRNDLDDCTDADGDGYGNTAFFPPVCPADCDDVHEDAFPGAAQVCDGYNNDCSDPSWPSVSPDECFPIENLTASTESGQVRLDWDLPPGGADLYRVYRGNRADLTAGRNGGFCFTTVTANTALFTDDPPPGGLSFYVVAGVRGIIEGSRGQDGGGLEREHADVCP